MLYTQCCSFFSALFLTLPLSLFGVGEMTQLETANELAKECSEVMTSRSRCKDSKCRKNLRRKSQSPKITIIFVADSVPTATINKINDFLVGGIQLLKTKGINYANVFHPHANCSSGQGYAAMSTGTFPTYHGIVNNSWIGADGFSFVQAIQDPNVAATGVYDPTNGLTYNLDDPSADPATVLFNYPAGVSPNNYTADTVADQLAMFSTIEQPTKVFAVCSDPEPATLYAGRLGKAIWQDLVTGLFTTGRYYYPEGLPEWITKFNDKNPLPSSFVWEPLYPVGSPPYNFPDAQNYVYSAVFPFVPIPHATLFGQTLPSVVSPYGALPFLSSPGGIANLFKFVEYLIDTQIDRDSDERLVLWINDVAFDDLGGLLGTQTQECLDMVYQFDKRFGELIKYVYKKYKPSECLFIFCNDEGKYPNIPELLQNEGFSLAQRSIVGFPPFSPPYPPNAPTDLITVLNNELTGASSPLPPSLRLPYVYAIIPPFIYMNAAIFNDPAVVPFQNAVLEAVRDLVKQLPGIRTAWTFNELIRWPFEKEDPARFYKLHLFINNPLAVRRSGEVIFQALPFNYVTTSLPGENPEPQFGVGHTSGYQYDSQTPLYLYQKGRYSNKIISTPVITQQIAISLAEILNVPRPSAASVDVDPLPGIRLKE